MPKVAVLGAGSWGTTYAKILCDAGCEVTIWARRPEQANEINLSHRNGKYLSGVNLPRKLRASSELETAIAGAKMVFLAVPSQSLRQNLEAIKPFLDEDAIIVSLIKGVEKTTNLRMSQLITEVLEWSIEQVAVVSGPNIALEIAREEPTGAVVACVNIEVAKAVAAASNTEYFRTYVSSDVTGCELGGVLKNLIALAIGIVDGVGYGENTKAAIITRGIAEMTEFAVASGANPTTMMGLAGLGDLITTCQSPLSRNSTAGRLIGQGYTREETAQEMSQVVEGITAIGPVLTLAKKRAVTMPIVQQVQMVLNGAMRPDKLGPHLATEDDVPEPETEFSESFEQNRSLWQRVSTLWQRRK